MKKIFIIGYVWPEPTASAAGVRMLQLIRFFREQDWQVHFGTPAMRPETAFNLEQMGVKVHEIRVNDDQFNVLLSQLCPDAVLFDRYMMEEQFGWRVAEYCPMALRILDTEDLHFLRKHRHAAVLTKSSPGVNELLEEPLARREIAAIYRCDLSLIISETEMELLEKVFNIPSALLVYHPIFAEDRLTGERKAPPGFSARRDMMFIGNYLHDPNADAVKMLTDRLWPGIKKELPDVRLHLYGAYMPERIRTKRSEAMGIEFHGRADSVDKVMKEARLLVAPLRFGAGLKGKLLRAMENGLPSVTTPVGAEGIAGSLEWGGVISDLNDAFVKAVVRLYRDQKAWDKAVQNGYKIVDARFSREAFERSLLGRLNALWMDPGYHRRNNFIGQMLMDQRNMASRYLSKYIMEKNKKS